MASNSKGNIHIGCGCLTDVIALILLLIVCDLLGCEAVNGFAKKFHDTFNFSNNQTQEKVIENGN